MHCKHIGKLMEKIVLKSSGISPTARLHHGYNYEIVRILRQKPQELHSTDSRCRAQSWDFWTEGMVKKQSSKESKVFLNVVPWQIVENRVACKPGCNVA